MFVPRPRSRPRRLWIAAIALALLSSCERAAPDPHRLPTGVALDPAGPSIELGSMPVSMIFSPDSSHAIAVLSGYREQGIQVVDLAARRVTQTLVQPAAFVGTCFSPEGEKLFVSGGDRDQIYVYAWRENAASLTDSITLGPGPGKNGGRVYPAGLACSADGARLYVAANLADSLIVVNVATHRVTQRLATGRYPYGVVVDRVGRVFVSAWGGSWVARFAPSGGALAAQGRIEVGLHPSAMTFDPSTSRLYVACASSDRIAIVDVERDSLVGALSSAAPGGPSEGSTPNAFALSPDGRRLYVAEADNDAVSVFALVAGGRPSAAGANEGPIGRIPVEWYPTALLARGRSLWVLNGKGHETGPNPKKRQPGTRGPESPRQYTLAQTAGSLTFLDAPDDGELAALSRRVAISNGWGRTPPRESLPPFEHVIYVIRENRTFDQVLGDLGAGDTDSSLTFFPRRVTPNAHALAERFGIFDRFLVSGEASGDGHNWSTAAYASDYVEKTIPSNYSGRGRSYDYDGLNRDSLPENDVNEPSNGYLWNLAQRSYVSMRNYGEFTRRLKDGRWVANKSWLAAHTDPRYPGWDLEIRDSVRADRWIAAFHEQEAIDSFPALSIVYLPNDHTAGGRAGSPTPRAYVADNDLALGRIVEAVSRSRYWKSTVVFVLEDDAQDGPDHVDSHRSPLLVISPYNRPGVIHRYANTIDVVMTIARILKLGALSKYDSFGHPLDDVFASAPDTSAYAALEPGIPIRELNADSTVAARLSRRLDLREEDRADPVLFNRILWLAVRGTSEPCPARPARPHS